MANEFWKYWQIETDRGRAVWKFTPPSELAGEEWNGPLSGKGRAFIEQLSAAFAYDKQSNPNSGDKVYRSQCRQVSETGIIKVNGTISEQVSAAAERGIAYYDTLQTPDGNWIGDYGGPMFLLPGLVIASYITASPFAAPQAAMMQRYMLNHQNEDGGWGMHLEGQSTMFGTVLQYVALRVLGMAAENPSMEKAKAWIKGNGGATGIPSWGKFYLSLLGVYEWSGCNSLFPEMWLLPEWLPMHPSRYWCHTRMVYLPMAYCYGHRVLMKQTDLTVQLRGELYTEPYEKIDWSDALNKCTKADLYYPQSAVLKGMNKLLNIYEKMPVKSWRKKALDFTLEYINAEDVQTNYINIGPVNQVINSIAIWYAYGADSDRFKKHKERWSDYLWVAEDGMKMQGYNGSQFWDTVFAVQAVAEAGCAEQFSGLVAKAHKFITDSQIQTEVPDRERFYRHMQVGGWPFSTLAHGWPITDCTGEGLKTVMLLEDMGLPKIEEQRLFDAVNVILSYQNKDGGWASYENTRAPRWLEWINPSEVFGNIMIDHPYTECSSACLQSLLAFQKRYAEHRKEEIDGAIKRGVEFILSQQGTDGSWYGSWAVCYTYGTWFGVEILNQYLKSHADESSALLIEVKESLDRAAMFLLSKQQHDGGWGESFESCVRKRYIPTDGSQAVNTSWALMSLMAIGNIDRLRIDKGIKMLMDRQQENGDWAQENISGVFNHNCMITYTSYRNVFPIWALGRYKKLYGTT